MACRPRPGTRLTRIGCGGSIRRIERRPSRPSFARFAGMREEKAEQAFIRAVRGDAREYNAEYRIVRPSDGQVRWIQVRSQIERDGEGHPLRLVGAHIDVTERKEAEEAVRKLNETLEQQVAERTRERDRLWRVSDDFIGVANARGYWDAINPAATAILGWSEAELLATPISDLWHP